MSDKAPGSSRLDSLSRKSTTAPKPGLKFQPKAVARRSKADRDAQAPIDKPDDKPSRPRGGLRGGRGGARGGKRGLQGTHVVQAGPLASGNVLNETKQNLSRSATMSPTPEFLGGLIKREPESTRGTSVGVTDSDDEGDHTKINMNDEYKYSKEQTELFPVRAPRAYAKDESIAGVSRALSPERDAVKRTEEETLQDVLEKKNVHLNKKLDQLVLDEAAEDQLKFIQDHKDIVKLISEIDNTKENYLMLQLPRVLPSFEAAATPAAVVKPEEDGPKPALEGEVASLRVHKSGKLTMKVGNVVMDVSKGSNATFLQQLVATRGGEEGGSYLLGHVREKLVVTPKFV